MLWVGLPRLRTLVNVYTSSSNRNDSFYTDLPDLIFFIRQISKITDIMQKHEAVPFTCINVAALVMGTKKKTHLNEMILLSTQKCPRLMKFLNSLLHRLF